MTDTRRIGWLLDERASAGRENLDESHVTRYDNKEDADAAAEVALLQDLGLDATHTVVDLGAGTGQFSLAAAPHCARVVAVDVSPVMQRVLRRKVADSGFVTVEFVASGFLTYEHRGAPVDFAYSRYALHHLPDFWKALALARIAGTMRPGAVLRLWDVVYSFEPHEADERIDAWCATLSADVGDADWNRGDIEEHVRDEHSTFSWLLEPMIERAGFGIEQADYSADGIFAKYVARKR
jgi:cyclopropane fatty-acyl-phospholipid synthase-like methyltransferase